MFLDPSPIDLSIYLSLYLYLILSYLILSYLYLYLILSYLILSYLYPPQSSRVFYPQASFGEHARPRRRPRGLRAGRPAAAMLATRAGRRTLFRRPDRRRPELAVLG